MLISGRNRRDFPDSLEAAGGMLPVKTSTGRLASSRGNRNSSVRNSDRPKEAASLLPPEELAILTASAALVSKAGARKIHS